MAKKKPEQDPAEKPVTIDDLIAAYGPRILELPANKRRDPVERELLLRLGDKVVTREDPSMTKVAGERARPPLPEPIKLQGEGPSASDIGEDP